MPLAAAPQDRATAAPGTVDNTYCPKRLASREIAQDIAEFERNGGSIQRLGVTRIFHRPADGFDSD